MYYAHIVKDTESGFERYQTCSEHAKGVAVLASEQLSGVGLSASGYAAGLIHDMGKFTEEFNSYLLKAAKGLPVKKGSVIHTFVGVRYLMEYFHSDGELRIDDLASEILSVGVGSHHGFMDLWNPRQVSGFEHRLRLQPEYDKQAIENFHRECAREEEVSEAYRKAKQELLMFFQNRIRPWIKNGKEGHFALGLLTRLVTSAVVEADRTDTACFMKNIPVSVPESVSWDRCIESIEKYLSVFSLASPIRKARAAFSQTCAESGKQPPGLFRLDLPTGGGKTLAALRFAVVHAGQNRMKRIFYVAPLISIIEQNAQVIRSAVNGSVPVMEHHSNMVREGENCEEAAQRELLQESWSAPLIVTTMVQLLETLFSGKMSSVRRFSSLAESVIILDEVQTLPPRMLTMFNCAVNFLTRCCGSTVVVCSATQPAFQKAEHPMLECKRLVDEKIYKKYLPLFKRTDIVDAGLCTMDRVTDLAQEILKDNKNLLIVCNTKKEAAGLYQLLKEQSSAKCFHLSAGMCMAHRKEMLAGLTNALQENEKLICVSTQVIEAGIDISFEAVIRFSAGLDNVVQAAGRCNRHGECKEKKKVYICRIADEKLGSLKEIREAQNALNALLSEYALSPGKYEFDPASDYAVDDYYSFLYRGMALGAQDYPVQEQSLFEMLSDNRHYRPDHAKPYFLNQAFRTAGDLFRVFENDSEGVIVPYAEGRRLIDRLSAEHLKYDLAGMSALLEQAKPFAVSVPATQIERMMERGLIYTLLDGAVFVLNDGYYDEETGIKEGNDLCSTLIL